MGCGASQSDVIRSGPKNTNQDQQPRKRESMLNNANGAAATVNQNNGNGKNMDSMSSSVLSESSTIPAADFYQDLPGRDGPLKPLPRSLPPLKPPRGGNSIEPPELIRNRIEPVAFEVPIEDDPADAGVSLIKRHPPRRLRKTMEDQLGEPLSLTTEVLEEKVQLANERRNQVLHERVASARQKSGVPRTRTRPVMDSELLMDEYGGGLDGGGGGKE